MSSSKLRRLTIDGVLFLWQMHWSYDRDGQRILHFSALFADPTRAPPRPRGQPVQARFVSREPEYPGANSAVLPGDARAAIDCARALGWDGQHALWLLPACGLERPTLVLTAKTRLREWAGDARLYQLSLSGPGLGALLAAELGVPFVSESEGADEVLWRNERWFVMSWRKDRAITIYCRDVAALITTLAATARCAPAAGLSLGATGAQVIGPGTGELPRSAVPPPEQWAALPGAVCYPGSRPGDTIWTLPEADGFRIEVYHHHADAPDRLWRWLRIHGDTAVEHRFQR